MRSEPGWEHKSGGEREEQWYKGLVSSSLGREKERLVWMKQIFKSQNKVSIE